jgi:hypothetical protein
MIPGPLRATHRLIRWAVVLLLCSAPALAAPPRVPKHAAAPKPPAAEELPGPEWRVDELTVLDDEPVTPTASVANAEGFVFAVYGKPNTFVKFRLEIPAPGLELVADWPLAMQVDSRLPNLVMRDDVMSDVLGRKKLRLDPRWVEWEFGRPTG